MNFYCIVDDIENVYNADSFRLLKEASEARGIPFKPISAKTFRFGSVDDFEIGPDDLLYRSEPTNRGRMLEALLMGKKPRTFYRDPQLAVHRQPGWGAVIAMRHAGVPIVPTIFAATASNGEDLEAYAEQLGGFPIIVKASGGSHGSSVMRVDGLESLRSVLGFVAGGDTAAFVLRKYVHNATHFRHVVLNGEVLDVIKYLPQKGDFRTNTGKPQVEAVKADPQIADIAIRAVEASGVLFGGVDVLVDSDGTPYIAEVNFPCNFARNQMNTGADIAGQMLDYLVKQ